MSSPAWSATRAWAVAAAVALLAPAGARAEMDSFLLGNGQDGPYSVASGSWMVINSYARVTAAATAGNSTVSVSSTAGFTAGDLVMVLQTTGLSPPPTTNGGTPIVISNQRVGQYELARISSVGASQLTFSRPLWQSYDANVTQVITVPEFTTVTIQQNAGIYAAPWDGSTGGVLAFLANGAVTNDGWIGAWDGFQGGPAGGGTTGYGCTGIDDANGASKGEGVASGRYPAAHGYGYLANGGGGGICHNSGGGGGGLGGVGGKGGRPCTSAVACDDSAGDYGGRGGAQLSFDPRTRLFMGGGGGGGEQNDAQSTAGGQGGGIVFVRAASMTRAGAINAGVDASGANAAAAGIDGAGGGGAGGTVSVRLTGTLDCDWLGADGARGGDIASTYHGPGGGGAGGVVLVQSAGAATCWFGANPGAHGVTPPSSSIWGTGFDAQDGSLGGVTTLTTAYAKPPAPVISSPGSQTNNTQPTLSGTVNRASTPIQMFVDGAPAARTTSGAGVPSSWSLQVPSVLSAGTHTLVVQSDVEGAASDPVTLSTRVTVNTTITGNPPSLTNSPSATFTFTPNPASTFTFACKLDGAATYTPCTSPATYSSLSNGSHTFRVHTVDPQGYAGPDATYTWTVDTVVPTVNIATGPSNPTNQTNASFTFTVNDAGATVQCSLDGGAYSACTSPRSYAGPLAQGSHTFDVRATDAAGNVGSSSWTWTIDTTAPSVSITSGPLARTSSTSAPFQFTVTGATTIECRLDAGSFAPCTSPQNLTGLGEGAHTFTVRGTDGAGNTSSASRNWTVDLTSPATSFSTTPPSITNATTASFAFFANEPSSTFECSLDGAAFAACASPTAPSVTEGSHSYSVRATDDVGNLGAAATFGWTVDLTPPDTLLVSGPGSSVGMGDVTITASSTETGSTFQCNLDAAGYSPCSATYVVASPAAGSHTVLIAAIDPAGNPDPMPLTVSFSVDFDRDRDGLTDDQEATLGTDPGRADSDNDMLDDGTEVNTVGTSPLDDDSDDDGLLDGNEVNLEGTLPLDPDTDGDGLTDGQERGLAVTQGANTSVPGFVPDADPSTRTDPLKVDTDDDGILDGLEDADRNGRMDAGETDPAKGDTDGDGLGDGLERVTAFNPTDPRNPDTDGDGLQDGAEDANHNGMIEATETDPNRADTDRGGVNDGLEVRGGTNALDPNDDYQVRGGGCSSSGAALAPFALLALAGLARRRRGLRR